MSSDNPLSDISEGIAKATLEWSAEQVSSLVKKLKEKNLAFIQEPKTIEIVREQYNSGEAKFYQNYIKDKELLLLVLMGLTLRKLENDKKRLYNLRDKTFKKYKVKGLHVAEFVQNGILNRYVGILIEELISINDLEKDIYEVLTNIEKHALFIQSGINLSEIIKKCVNIVNVHSPNIFIVSGTWSVAEVLRKGSAKLEESLKEYKVERFSSSGKETLFFKRKITK